MKPKIRCERIIGWVVNRRVAGKDLCGRWVAVTGSQIRITLRRIEAGEPATQAALNLGMSRPTLYRVRDRPYPTDA
ncbi:hypothetical protein [Kocuria arenosa]|uniref:hypothetical protein n=1 Tax=Kocuria arenosa TaxID=3071446 RepID=UPI0034D569F9